MKVPGGGQRPNRWMVFSTGLFAQCVFSATFLGLPAASLLVQNSLELSYGQLALLLGGASFAVVLSEFPWGLTADRFGERKVLLVGVTGTAVALGLVAFVSARPDAPAWMLAALLFAAAALGGAVTGPSGSAILGWFDARRHGTLLSLRVAAVPAGGALGTLVYSSAITSWGLSYAIALFTGAVLVCAFLIALFVFDPPCAAHDLRGSAALPLQSSALRKLTVWRIALSGMFLDVSQFLVLAFGATILAVRYGYPPAAGVGRSLSCSSSADCFEWSRGSVPTWCRGSAEPLLSGWRP